jgi:hypothetical protein
MAEEKEQREKANGKTRAVKVTKQVAKMATAPVKVAGKIVGTILLNIAAYAILLVVTLLVASKLLLPAFGNFIEELSPMKRQADAIERRNNTKDAFSAIKGSTAEIVPNLDAIQWVTGKKHELTLWLPKITNDSPIFKDERNQELLYESFGYSVNREFLDQEFDDWKVYYDGHIVAEPSGDGETTTVYGDVSKQQVTLAKKELQEIISKQSKYPKVKQWEETSQPKKLPNGHYQVVWKYDAQHFLSLFSKKVRYVTVEIDFSDVQPRIIEKTLKITKGK